MLFRSSEEATDLARRAYRPQTPTSLISQYSDAATLLGPDAGTLFNATALRAAHPGFDYKGRFQGNTVINAAFAVEAIKRRLVRCVSFVAGGFDTHSTNYRYHPLVLQETFEMLAALLRELDATSFDGGGDRLSDHTHILVISDFCRTPQINLTSGRDHYPNNSALIISPRFRANTVYGRSDPEQLLPLDSGSFSDGVRPVTPPDVLATFLGAFGVDPRKYMRDGEVVKELLR